MTLDTPQLPPSAPIEVRVRSREDRERLVREAASKHYQDQPYTTSGLLGALLGGVGGGVVLPAISSYLAGTPMYQSALARQQAIELGIAGAALGGVAGVGNEGLGRLLTRTAGPQFRPSRWAYDQDPHRWNAALRMAPIGATLLAGKALPHLLTKQAGICHLVFAWARTAR